jgi:hypothetical protein
MRAPEPEESLVADEPRSGRDPEHREDVEVTTAGSETGEQKQCLALEQAAQRHCPVAVGRDERVQIHMERVAFA